MSWNWRLDGVRGAPMIDPMHQRLDSGDGERWALGRNVKRSLGDHRFDAVEVWTLKHRVNGLARVHARYRDRAEAEKWVKGQQIEGD